MVPLFRGERSPNRERDSTLGNRAGDESLALPLICQVNFITVLEMLPPIASRGLE
ncbi:MAG TPA: hypothetical protein VFG01_05130 [Acidobacteriota bacterium]|nr:hypothetical protein [Acidobacteriota bacterium]